MILQLKKQILVARNLREIVEQANKSAQQGSMERTSEGKRDRKTGKIISVSEVRKNTPKIHKLRIL